MLIQYRCLSIPFQIFYATYQPQNVHDFLSFWLNAIVKFDLLSGQKGPYQQQKSDIRRLDVSVLEIFFLLLQRCLRERCLCFQSGKNCFPCKNNTFCAQEAL